MRGNDERNLIYCGEHRISDFLHDYQKSRINFVGLFLEDAVVRRKKMWYYFYEIDYIN